MNTKGYSHKLNELIKKEVTLRKQDRKAKASVRGVMEDLADYCKVTVDAIINYRKYKTIPVLPVAFRLAEFFNITVLELYQIEDYDLTMGIRNQSNGRGRKKESYNISCSECGEEGYAKGLCHKHYLEHRRNRLHKNL
ncbi:helix-turn-helix transcriptional regulator (plasmid) [Paenibacillus peoriae]|uniref:Helix-turn-helix transcriptional regulator n=1 Tax=Paenibacillus peoriae TaxID=59893 RepID=A0A7H0YHB5_9BACL|nr:helix-turn-helix transcriptional regulator [Paenibacillus peoriae]QNR70473.1 helix-turn-helix transcriptional regulator [Paenibacillus peoriae]